MELAIDTATEVASIALSRSGEVEAEMSWAAGGNQTVELIPNLLHLLHRAGTELKEIQAIIVATGPGSFNGLRVGVGTAKGLAFALDIPVVGIGTLEAEAFPHAEKGLPTCPVQDVGRGEIAAALYQQSEKGQKGNGWRQLIAEHITTVEELCSQTASKTLFCGRFSPDIAQRIEERLGERAVISRNTLCRARPLAELGWQRLAKGDLDHPTTLQPLYLRCPAITTPKRGKR